MVDSVYRILKNYKDKPLTQGKAKERINRLLELKEKIDNELKDLRKEEKAINRRKKSSLAMCKKFIHDEDEALLLQSLSLEKVWKYRDKFEGTDNTFKGWLYTVIKNTFLSQKDSDKRKGIKVDINDHWKHPSVESSEDTFEKESLLKNIEYTILSVFQERDALIFKKSAFEGFKYDEIAGEFNIPIGTVKNRIHHVRQYLLDENNIKTAPEVNGVMTNQNLLTQFPPNKPIIKTRIQHTIHRLMKKYNVAT